MITGTINTYFCPDDKTITIRLKTDNDFTNIRTFATKDEAIHFAIHLINTIHQINPSRSDEQQFAIYPPKIGIVSKVGGCGCKDSK